MGKKSGTLAGAIGGFFLGGPVGAIIGAYAGNKVSDQLEKLAEERDAQHRQTLSHMRKAINNAIAAEDRTQKTKSYLASCVIPEKGEGDKVIEVDEVILFLKSYVQEMPDLLEALERAAENSGIRRQILLILDAAESYYNEGENAISNSKGLFGLLDDAYFTHKLIEEVNQLIKKQNGQPLLNINLVNTNKFAAKLMPKNVRKHMDDKVKAIMEKEEFRSEFKSFLKGVGIQLAIASLMAPRSPVFNDPIYGNMSQNEIVNHRVDYLKAQYDI